MRAKDTARLPFLFCSTLSFFIPSAEHKTTECNCCSNILHDFGGFSRRVKRKTDLQRLQHDATALAASVEREQFIFQLHGRLTSTKKRAKSSRWLHDSGASTHCCNDITRFHSITDANPNISLRVANNNTVSVKLIGTIVLELENQFGVLEKVLITNVCYTPGFQHNILSVSRLWHENRLKTKFGRQCYLKSQTGSKYLLSSQDSPYMLTAETAMSAQTSLKQPNFDAQLWHSRFMHSGNTKMRHMSRKYPFLSQYCFDSSKCDICLQGGARKQHFGPKRPPQRKTEFRKRKVYTYFGERITCDLCGPFEESVGDKCVYAIVFYDVYSKRAHVYFLQTKSKEEVLSAFKQFLADNKAYLVKGVKEYHTDNGSEFINSDMDAFCEEICIRRTYTVPYAPPQNAYAERMWGILLKKMRCALLSSKLPDSFWTYAMSQACLVHNILVSTDSGVCPEFLVTGTEYMYEKLLRVFGCKCYWLVPEHDRPSKLSPPAYPAVYLGNDPNRNGVLVYIPHLHRITSAYHVVLSENEFLSKEDMDGSERFKVPVSKRVTINLPPSETGTVPTRVVPADAPSTDTRADADDIYNPEMCEHDGCEYHKNHDGPHSNDRISGRTRSTDSPIDYVRIIFDDVIFDVCLADLSSGAIKLPESYEQALASVYGEKWKEAMAKEIRSLIAHGTWEAVSRSVLPKGRKPTKSRWVFTIKYLRDGTIERFKARFVVCGYSQVKGKDYERAFSATLRASSFRCLLAIAAGRKLREEWKTKHR